ncbi:hypothetical protein LTR10_020222 [Elasticomyces elasticus]|uniref:C2H2-type domain-containing protein n=1 Tax=Exophiala sideris TaxID=1016849 RepID=A0ABR0JRS0_9EURO|nr:hypothetical protein LTR10_020222 [Elasticomyces elasticus]KAK5040284.1 hypothetical protein LTS07_000781 [Exophiala sideris]KAK5043290.1 hypothetical protein LTR13_001061 [Exophiala sideris]KAK5068662.1 hypothetical protein LTR69_000782 [Exophiala sideris]KAK5186260.1 hypothetical protein LTR44_001315 [Eurotiomycetes sp. CCFEE 6388]
MGRNSPQGLTASDFHHPSYVNPVDVFPAKTRLGTRAQNFRSPIRGQVPSRSPSRLLAESHKFACCGEDEVHPARPSSALACCSTDDDGSNPIFTPQQSISDYNEPLHSSPSPMDCEDCVDDCDDCVEEHEKYNHQATQDVDDCKDCIEAEYDHLSHGPLCNENCDDCDFSCFDCIDWTEFEQDKSLGLSFSVPLLGDNTITDPEPQFDDNDMLNFQEAPNMQPDLVVPPLDIPMHHQCFGDPARYWDSMAQAQICTGPSGLPQQFPLPPFALEYGCHPATAHQQMPLPPVPPNTQASTTYAAAPSVKQEPPPFTQPAQAPLTPLNNTDDLLSAISVPSTSLACQWIMPCGTVCGASFASGTDLKKHLKAVHLVKGVTKCAWQGCESATFASEAALTGHMSKKHLAPLLSASSSANNADATAGTDGPFKCTYPGCPKSFMYKQVRDEHVASCHNGNKMYCHICGQYLNGEGSNFKRHMATHRPKHQHMLCKFEGLGCKRRFPRLDNLRRHEACCKFGKKAGLAGANVKAGAHHHHHHHEHVHTANS